MAPAEWYMGPPASTRVSARLKRIQEHSSPTKLRLSLSLRGCHHRPHRIAAVVVVVHAWRGVVPGVLYGTLDGKAVPGGAHAPRSGRRCASLRYNAIILLSYCYITTPAHNRTFPLNLRGSVLLDIRNLLIE